MISQKQVISVRASLGYDINEMAEFVGVEPAKWEAWEIGREKPECMVFMKMFFSLFSQQKLFISSSSKQDVVHHLTRASHLNRKMADQAMGADSTMHEIIDDELSSAIKTLK